MTLPAATAGRRRAGQVPVPLPAAGERCLVAGSLGTLIEVRQNRHRTVLPRAILGTDNILRQVSFGHRIRMVDGSDISGPAVSLWRDRSLVPST